ncbi:MAG: hypothetical protein WC525_07520 [Candidatus Thermoplasmatota archaeon]
MKANPENKNQYSVSVVQNESMCLKITVTNIKTQNFVMQGDQIFRAKTPAHALDKFMRKNRFLLDKEINVR